MEKAQDRLEVLARIETYEKNGWFDRDVENDPPSRSLRPGEVDYTGEKLSTRIATKQANIAARKFIEDRIKDGTLVIKDVIGIENYLAVKDGGAVITCNHFNAFDNFAVYKAIEDYLPDRIMYKVIREGNYTSFPGLYGYFFRHCNTLPLSANMSVLRELMAAVKTLLDRGEKILIYPEQGMWWNYRKPRPLKLGGFQLACRSKAPVVPFFITTEETDRLGEDGFPILAYTVHILPAIHYDETMTARENAHRMCEENYAAWKQVYETVYGIPLTYTTEGEVSPCSI